MTYTKYQIQGIIGAGYLETAYYNPKEGAWESRGMDSARYDIESRAEAEAMLDAAKADQDVSEVAIEEIIYEVED